MSWLRVSAIMLLLVSIKVQAGLVASPEPDWPQWRGVRRDGLSNETGLLTQWPPAGPPLVWQKHAIGKGWSCPIVVNEHVYVTGDVDGQLVIYAFDAEGKERWRTTNGKEWKKPYPGARSCVTYSEGRLYHLNAHGRLVCLAAETGEELWHVQVLERFAGKNIRWALSESLLVDGEHVYVTPGGEHALIAALDKHTGQTLWATPALDGEPTSYSSPILFSYQGRRLIATCSEAHGFGVDADTGAFLWDVPLKNPYGTNAASPLYHDGAVYYVAPRGPKGSQYRIKVGARDVSVEHHWTGPLDTLTGGGVILGDTLYASGYRDAKWWMALDWQTGALQYETKELTTGAAISAEGLLYILDEQGKVGLLKPGRGGFEKRGLFQITQKKIKDAWAHPVLCDGRLFIRYHDNLWCYDVRRPQN